MINWKPRDRRAWHQDQQLHETETETKIWISISCWSRDLNISEQNGLNSTWRFGVEFSWLESSTCFPCDINVSLYQQSATIDASFHGFFSGLCALLEKVHGISDACFAFTGPLVA